MNEQGYDYINKCFNELKKELKQEQATQLELIKSLQKEVTNLKKGRNIPKEVYIFIIYIIVIIGFMLIAFKVLTRGI